LGCPCRDGIYVIADFRLPIADLFIRIGVAIVDGNKSAIGNRQSEMA